ncbi:glycoside hydrolase family 3 N-terminal domain-containing protein [Wenyingzhuangia sp. IMCC45574]
MRYVIVLLFVFVATTNSFCQQKFTVHNPLLAKDRFAQEVWVDSLLNKMTLDEKIGQLFMVQAYSNKDEAHEQEIQSYIEKYHIGGLIFMQGTPIKQVELYNKYQSKAKTPLLVGFDGEWGLSMRIKPSFAYPWNMTLGAVQDDRLIYKVAQRIGEHCKEVGVHINFAPVVDINTNPLNPIIGNRSFGEDRNNVTRKARVFIEGMQSVGVLANAKHFPGHGDTAADSHKTLPVVKFDWKRLDSLELYPYKQLVNSNLASIMVAHLDIPSLQTQMGRPTSLAKGVVTDLLQRKLGFGGLVFTDGLNMNGVASYTTPDLVSLEAFKAGNDMLLIPMDVANGVDKIRTEIQKGNISEERLNYSVKKVLQAKYLADLQHLKELKQEGLQQRIHTNEDDRLFKKVAEKAVTLVKNDANLLPLQRLDTLKVASVSLGDASSLIFENTLDKYTTVTNVKGLSVLNYQKKLADFNTVVIGFHKSSEHPWKSYKFTNGEVELINKIAQDKKVILTVFTSPYSLLQLNGFKKVSNVVVAYQNNPVFQSVAAQQIFGALPYLGKLPVSVSNQYKVGSGITRGELKRMQYGTPKEVGLDAVKLSKIDSVANAIIKKKMTPGLQVLVARKGKVVFEKAYGYYTYDSVQRVSTNSMYDLASLTKVIGAMPLFLKGFETGKYKLDNKLAEVLPEFKESPIANLLLIDMLTHQSGLKAWIPFYLKTLDSVSKQPMKKWYHSTKNKDYSVRIAQNMYMKKEYVDSVFQTIKTTPLRDKINYKYTDLTFLLSKKMFEKFYNKPMEKIYEDFYTKNLGATRLTYKPLLKYAKDSIVPSEKDTYYRNQTLQGDVHDMAAAMLGGVSGNAGLFGNANDVAKIMQLYLNKGFYGGKQYFRSNTFNVFNKAYFATRDNRRGLVLDKPDPKGKIGNTCNCVSKESFGHSGFTGTYTWADPKTELIYVFLSNRTYPTMDNNDLGRYDIRTNIQQMIQEAIEQ